MKKGNGFLFFDNGDFIRLSMIKSCERNGDLYIKFYLMEDNSYILQFPSIEERNEFLKKLRTVISK